MAEPRATQSLSIRQLRNLIVACLILGIGVYTALMFMLAERLSERFGPQVQVDLEWRVQRGAQEVARAAEIGLAISDPAIVTEAFGAYAKSDDVQAIVALDAAGKVVAQHGRPPAAPEQLFAGKPASLRATRDYLVSWAPAKIEEIEVGKIAVVVSTRRLREADVLLEQSSNTTLVGGLAALVLGVVVVAFFARAVAQRDTQLSDYAANLERRVEDRTRELDERNQGMRLVLDNVAQGFVTINVADGVMATERSAIVDRWFGTPTPGTTLAAYLAPRSRSFAEWLELGLSQMRDGFLPVDLLIDQLPARVQVQSLTCDVAYTPLGPREAPDKLLVIFSDVTEKLSRERAEAEQRELVAFFQRVSVDRSGVQEFVTEAAHLVGALRQERDPTVQKRLVHTLKGNCAIYGLASIAELAHEVESELQDKGGALAPEQRDALVNAWKKAVQRVGWLLSTQRRDIIEVDRAELELLAQRAREGISAKELASALTEWAREPVHRRLDRLGQQAVSLARRLNKPAPEVTIDDHGVRVDSGPWSAFWAATVHVVRNAVDHGIEDPQERLLLGKAEAGALCLSAVRQAGMITISIGDDGRGIDWNAVRAKAARLGLSTTSEQDLIIALFSDGVSTRDSVTDLSGRGVGLGAVRQAVQELGGRIEVDSTLGKGTTFRFTFDEQVAAAVARPRMVYASLLPAAS